MLRNVLDLAKADLTGQTSWLRNRALREGRSIAVTLALAVGAALAAAGATVVGLIAVYTWAERYYGSLQALGLIGLVLLLVSGLLLALALWRSRAEPEPQPRLLLTDPATGGQALRRDFQADSEQLLRALKGSAVGPALNAGERLFKVAGKAARVTTGQMRHGSALSLAAILGAAAIVGVVLGRRR